MDIQDFKRKLLKYKNKYLKLLNNIQNGGVLNINKILDQIIENNKYRFSQSPYQIIVNHYKNNQDFIEGFIDSYEKRIEPCTSHEYMKQRDGPRDYYIYGIGYNTGRLYKMYERVKNIMIHGYLTGVHGEKIADYMPTQDEILLPYIEEAYKTAFERGVIDFFKRLHDKKDPKINIALITHPLTGETEQQLLLKLISPRPTGDLKPIPLRRTYAFRMPNLYVDSERPESSMQIGPGPLAPTVLRTSEYSSTGTNIFGPTVREERIYDINKVLDYYDEIRPIMYRENIIPVELDYDRLLNKDNNSVKGYLPAITDLFVFRLINKIENIK